MCRTQYVRQCPFGPRVTPRFSHHLFSGIYSRSAAAAIKANSVVQGHTTALKENDQLCDTELFGSLCLCVGSQVNSDCSGWEVELVWSWILHCCCCYRQDLKNIYTFKHLLSEAKHKSTFSEILWFFKVVFHKWCGSTVAVLHKIKPDVPRQCLHSKNGWNIQLGNMDVQRWVFKSFSFFDKWLE